MKVIHLLEDDFMNLQSISNIVDGYSALDVYEAEGDLKIMADNRKYADTMARIQAKGMIKDISISMRPYVIGKMAEHFLSLGEIGKYLIDIVLGGTYHAKEQSKPVDVDANVNLMRSVPKSMAVSAAAGFSLIVEIQGAAVEGTSVEPYGYIQLYKDTFNPATDDATDPDNLVLGGTYLGIQANMYAEISKFGPGVQAFGGAGSIPFAIQGGDGALTSMVGKTTYVGLHTQQKVVNNAYLTMPHNSPIKLIKITVSE